MARIAVIGTGYVGLTAAVCFAHLGHDVIAADLDMERVAALRAGQVPFLEEDAEGPLREGLSSGRLRVVVGAAAAVRHATFVFLCVPTPQGPDGAADLRFL